MERPIHCVSGRTRSLILAGALLCCFSQFSASEPINAGSAGLTPRISSVAPLPPSLHKPTAGAPVVSHNRRPAHSGRYRQAVAQADLKASAVGENAQTVVAGPLQLTSQAKPDRGEALVTVELGGQTVSQQVLTLTDPLLVLDFASGKNSTKGVVTLQLRSPPLLSSVAADLTASDGTTETPYRGNVQAWTATQEPVFAVFTQPIDGTLSARTTVRGMAGNIAQFDFVSGQTVIGSLLATQLAPTQVFATGITAGSTQISPGTTITLGIPTQLQPGTLFLQSTITTATTPPTPISAQVAQWSLPTAH